MSAIDLVVVGRPHDLGGGFNVRRALPAMQRRHVGPFVFFDEMGPVEQPTGVGMDVRPHPHIALATLTYLFDGAIEHRDSLGTHAVVIPGDVNWMIAGQGIAHSERSPEDERKKTHRIHGIQAWVGLHTSEEESPPRFVHHDAAELPLLEQDGCTIRLISGTAFGATAPTPMKTPTIYADVRFAAGGELSIPSTYEEVAIYVVDGTVTCEDQAFEPGAMVIFHPHADAAVRAAVRRACHRRGS